MKLKRLFNLYAASIALIFSIGSINAADTDTIGNQVVSDLTQRYQSKVEGCGADKSLPAFECSGVISRITGHGNYDPWNPSPNSQNSGGISFLYWRSDIASASFGTSSGNGYILNAPEKSQATGKMTPYVLCYFPHNAISKYRGGESGCGEIPHSLVGEDNTYINNSSTCQLQNIYTAEEWYNKYITVGHGNVFYLCGFNVRDYSKDTKGNAQSAFYQGLRASSLLWQHRDNTYAAEAIKLNNEFILRVWEQNIPQQLPIQAFFYLTGSTGKEYAMHDQKLFYDQTKTFVPVIKVTIPAIDTNAAEFPQITFNYQAEDQSVKSE